MTGEGLHHIMMPNGIDKFKMSFGGVYREYYNLYVVCSLLSRIYERITDFINR